MEIESQDMPAIFAREMKFINWNWWAVVSAQGRKTCPGANISPFKGTFVDDVPFPQVGNGLLSQQNHPSISIAIPPVHVSNDHQRNFENTEFQEE